MTIKTMYVQQQQKLTGDSSKVISEKRKRHRTNIPVDGNIVVIPKLQSDDVACSDETLVNKCVLNSSSLLCLTIC